VDLLLEFESSEWAIGDRERSLCLPAAQEVDGRLCVFGGCVE
jgi:hypothetical protein